jgi:hypothetical protein
MKSKRWILKRVDPEEVRSLLGHCVIRMGGPIACGCVCEPNQLKPLSSSFAIYVRTWVSQKPEGFKPIPVYNDNKGAIEWSGGCSVSKKLRHLNIRELAFRDSHSRGDADIKHIPGHSNIADLFTKEMKSSTETFRSLCQLILSPRDLGGC